MEYTILKNSALRVSRLALGGCPLGGHGWGRIEEDDLYQAVGCAVEKGINFFDTADVYGLGKSEEILGRALRFKRSKVVIASKFGVRIHHGKTVYDNSPEWIEQAVVESLKRLQTDYIDLYQIHYRDATPIGTVIETLEKLQKRGVIRYIGLSNLTRADLKELQAYRGKFSSLQQQYSLACREGEDEINDICAALEVTPMTWGSLGQGILTGKYGADTSFSKEDRRSRDSYTNFHGKRLDHNLRIVEKMRGICEREGKPMSALAIRFIWQQIPGSVALAGAKNAAQVASNAEAAEWELKDEQMQRLREVSEEAFGDGQ